MDSGNPRRRTLGAAPCLRACTTRAVAAICEAPEQTVVPLLQRRIFFVWTVREMAASEWFMELLRDLKLLDFGGILSISVHVTGHMPQQVTASPVDSLQTGLLSRHFAAASLHSIIQQTHIPADRHAACCRNLQMQSLASRTL